MGLSLLLISFATSGSSSIAQEGDAELEPSLESGLGFAAAFDFKGEWLDNLALGEREQDDLHAFEEEIQLSLSYRRDSLLAFGEIKGIAKQMAYANARSHRSENALERGEMWVLLFKDASDNHASLQMGRQHFLDPRLWWWDADLDAARFYYAAKPWRFYVGVAEELGRTATHEGFIDPEEEKVQRLLGYMDWTASEQLHIGGFFLVQRDRSGAPAIDQVVKDVREDESDADLFWAGLRATGVFDASPHGYLGYRADIARVTGDEILTEFGVNTPGFSRVTEARKGKVHGWAADIDVTWSLPLPGDPSLKLAYAYGSGDRHLDDPADRAFRQTGLQDQDEEFRDYGVVLRPELSNLRIATLMFGLPVSTDTRLTLGYHRFRQVVAAPFLRNTSIDGELSGESKDIGEEVNLVLQFREWEDLQMDIIAGSFSAGRAYGVSAGERANRLFFKLTYEF